ncbi:hypothetical protein [Sulfuritalea sp.]|uniref:hypothetical protein n=1 Tax=Sulfuritalea sp. TaxID=2480090 RepID=UPI001ACAF680|nr:hypothetical protein [Sulfuritalea sp.]MBN8477291.1 hypothetical protein [Sulfuritalea sp.]
MSGAVANLSLVAEGGPLATDAMTVRLGAGFGLPDLAIGASDCGQYLMLTCGGELIALIGAMGSDVETVEFADGSRYRVEELMDRVAG